MDLDVWTTAPGHLRTKDTFEIRRRVSKVVGWCFKSSQPQRVTSGLMETVIKRYIVERTNKAEIRPEKQ